MGVQRGDRVCAFLPNAPHAIVAFLAAASLGAIWSVLARHGPLAVLDRFRQIEPKVLIGVDGYVYGGVAHDRMAVLRQLLAGCPACGTWVLLRYRDGERGCGVAAAGARCTTSPLGTPPRAEFSPEWLPFDHRYGLFIRAAPPACPSPSCTAMAASCWNR